MNVNVNIKKNSGILKSIQGFTLIELSLVVVIISVTASSMLTMALHYTALDKIKVTESRMQKIEDALELYVVTNGRLPCPADGTLPRISTNFGQEQLKTSTINPCIANYVSTGNAYITSGIVPIRTLQLEDEVLYDGWGRSISYAVDGRFALTSPVPTNTNTASSTSTVGSVTYDETVLSSAGPWDSMNAVNANCKAGGPNQNCFRYLTSSSGSIQVNGSSSQSRTKLAAYVLISHGKYGQGAFPMGGGTQISNIGYSADAIENCDAQAFNGLYVQKTRDEDTVLTNYFDDIVHYKEKWQLLGDAGILFDASVCEAARLVTSKTPATLCARTATDQASVTMQMQCMLAFQQLSQQILYFCMDQGEM